MPSLLVGITARVIDEPDATPREIGSMYADQHKLDMAIAEYQKAIELDPKYAGHHTGLGNVYWDQHKPEVAIAEYQRAIELDPKYALPHNNLGRYVRVMPAI